MFNFFKRDTSSHFRKPRLTEYETGGILAHLNYDNAISYYRSLNYPYKADIFNSIIKACYEEIEDDYEFIDTMTNKCRRFAVSSELTSPRSVGKRQRVAGISDGYINIITEESNLIDITVPRWQELKPIKVVYSRDYDLTITHPSRRKYKGYMIVKVDLPMLMFQYRAAIKNTDETSVSFLYRYPYLNMAGGIFDLAILNSVIYGGKLTEDIRQPIDKIPVLNITNKMLKQTRTIQGLPFFRRLDNPYLQFSKLIDFTSINTILNNNNYWVYNMVYLPIIKSLLKRSGKLDRQMNRSALAEIDLYVSRAITNRSYYRNKYVKGLLTDIQELIKNEME